MSEMEKMYQLLRDLKNIRRTTVTAAELLVDACEERDALQEAIDLLQKQILSAPVAIMDTRVALGLCAPTESDFPALYELQGHRVALIDLGTANLGGNNNDLG